jgi:DNA mismatch repair protein MutS2
VAATLDRAAKATRKQIEEAAAAQQAEVERLQAVEGRVEAKQRATRPTTPAPVTRAPAPIAEGDSVSVATLGGRTGKVVALVGGARQDARVVVGAITVTVPLAELTRVGREAPQVVIHSARALPDVEASPEVDVRGMRVHEVDDAVMHALDAAVRADLRALRIIHGKGTGALRERVTEMLRKDTRISAFRLGAWNEGGAGVTVAELA